MLIFGCLFLISGSQDTMFKLPSSVFICLHQHRSTASKRVHRTPSMADSGLRMTGSTCCKQRLPVCGQQIDDQPTTEQHDTGRREVIRKKLFLEKLSVVERVILMLVCVSGIVFHFSVCVCMRRGGECWRGRWWEWGCVFLSQFARPI